MPNGKFEKMGGNVPLENIISGTEDEPKAEKNPDRR